MPLQVTAWNPPSTVTSRLGQDRRQVQERVASSTLVRLSTRTDQDQQQRRGAGLGVPQSHHQETRTKTTLATNSLRRPRALPCPPSTLARPTLIALPAHPIPRPSPSLPPSRPTRRSTLRNLLSPLRPTSRLRTTILRKVNEDDGAAAATSPTCPRCPSRFAPNPKERPVSSTCAPTRPCSTARSTAPS